ncbi:IS21-like element helper ATPase IstB [Phosphitispora sp. TUW77]|uniref:IS21-like element helper ATPase IstB n=1 Tax=Phosphitispora sp. TUW77 TaxID=3152361 RepID=UPI003AB692F2
MITEYCKKLKIGRTFYKDYKEIEVASNQEFLLRLLEMEFANREITRKRRLLKAAGFDVMKTFQDYSFEHIEIPKSIALNELTSTDFIQNKQNLILYGPVGTGKTHLATALGVESCNQGKSVRFFRTAALVNQLSEAKKSGSLNKYMRQIQKCDLLICDEWGYVPFEKGGAQLLFQVISECYEKRSVIITTNLEFSNWNGIFYDEKMTSAIIDRLVHHSHLLVFGGPSYRLTHSSINC